MSQARILPETYYVSAFWGDRVESIDTCITRLQRLLISLRSINPVFTSWYRWDNEDAIDKMLESPDLVNVEEIENVMREARSAPLIAEETEALKKIFLNGILKNDEKSPLPHLGIHVDLWSESQSNISIRVVCNVHARRKQFTNSCIISIPEKLAALNGAINIQLFENVLKAVVRSWNPNVGVASSYTFSALWRKEEEKSFRMPDIGWITYFSSQRGTLPLFPGKVRVEYLEDLGNMIIITDKLIQANNSEFLELAKQVVSVFETSHLLQPIPQIDDEGFDTIEAPNQF